MPTRLDVINSALRRIAIISVREEAEADMVLYAGGVLDSLFDELKTVHKMAFTWDLSATPDAVALPLAYLLATEIAPHYERPSEPRSRAMARLNAYAFPDDRTDSRDLDEDGTVTVEEAADGKRAEFF